MLLITIRLVTVGFSFVNGLLILVGRTTEASAQGSSECLPRCWDRALVNQHTFDGIKQDGIKTVDECKELCVNTEACVSVDWDNSATSWAGCYLQLDSSKSIHFQRDVIHWRLANCTDDCVPYCWKPVQNNTGVTGGIFQNGISDESQCKLFCAKMLSCTGIDWITSYSACYTFNITGPLDYNRQGVRHWSIVRSGSNVCESTSSSASTSSSDSNNLTDAASTIPTFPESTNLSGINSVPAVIALAACLAVSMVINVVFLSIIIHVWFCRKMTVNGRTPGAQKEEPYQQFQRTSASDESDRHSYTELQDRPTKPPVLPQR